MSRYETKQGRLYMILKTAILNGQYPYGTKLPSELSLSDEYGVSRVTVRAAIDMLVKDSFIKKKAGYGTSVIYKNESNKIIQNSLSSLIPDLKKIGQETDVKLLEFFYMHPNNKVAKELSVSTNEKVQRSVRIRFKGDIPFSYLVAYVNEKYSLHYDALDLATTPLYLLLEKSGVLINKARETITAIGASFEIAEKLQVQVGSPLLLLNRTILNDDGQGVEYLEAYYRPDFFQLTIDLERTGTSLERTWKYIPS